MFMDRDGKYQLAALAESSFDPLARTTQFMLTEEAHHLFVGETGVSRIVKRTGELMKLDPNKDPRSRRHPARPDPALRQLLVHQLDGPVRRRGPPTPPTSFASGLKGRYRESDGIYKDPRRSPATYTLPEVPTDDGKLEKKDIPLRRAMNAVLLDAYIADCKRIVERWNRVLDKLGVHSASRCPTTSSTATRASTPASSFNPAGEPIDEATWTHRHTIGCRRRPTATTCNSCMVQGHRARQVRELHRAADAGRERQAGRLRIRAFH
jgi:benzoyl-CoA 2,3-epoxidase subunit B